MILLSALGGIGPELSVGGQGTVYELLARPGEMLKRYHPHVKVDLPGLESLVEWRSTLAPGDLAVINRSTAWPVEVVDCEDGTFGFVMPRASAQFWHTLEGETSPRDLSWAFMADSARYVGLTPASPVVAVILMHQLSIVFDVFHRNQISYGDLSAANVLWSGGNRPTIFVLDCDATQLTGRPPALKAAETMLWKCPWPGVAARERDEYKLALAFLRLYFRYEGPLDYNTRHVQLPAHPPVTREAADLLAAGLREISTRPAASDWFDALRSLERGLRARKVA
jgi:hypothetical protein